MHQKNLFLAFFRVGIFGYGGGPASIPLVHKEAVEKYKWITDDDFSDILALGNSLPGPIATKMAGYIGFKVAGYRGMINSVLATILPTIVLMILLIVSINSLRDYPWVAGMTQAVMPVVGVMLGKLTLDFFLKAKKGLGFVVTSALVAGTLVAIEVVGIHPGILIFCTLVFALLYPGKRKDTILRKQEQIK